jgi:outer membrane protein assembly factor BamA
MTNERVIRNELLFQEGDIYDQSLVEESERNLRTLNFIGGIAITADTLRDSIVNINVRTHDRWTLDASPSYQQGGGVRSFGMTVKDDNLFGNGQSLAVGYQYRNDLVHPHGGDVIFSDRRLFASHWGTKLQFKTSQDENIWSILLNRNFYADAATWAASLYYSNSDQTKPYYESGVRVRETYVHQQNLNGYYSLSFGRESIFRPSIAYVGVRTTGDSLRPNDNLGLVNVGLNFMDRKYVKGRFINNHGRVEDVPVGIFGNIVVGKNFYFPTGSEPQYLVQLDWQQAFTVGDNTYASYRLDGSSLFGRSSRNETVVEGNAGGYVRLGERNILAIRTAFIDGLRWSPDRQLFLGSNSGLRGYDNFTLTGQKLLNYSVEERVFFDNQIWIFRPGFTFFADGGSIWNYGPFLDQQFHHSAGVGLRIENTKAQGLGIIRIDFAYNFDRRKFGQIILSGNLHFSAFNDFSFIAPTTTGLLQ